MTSIGNKHDTLEAMLGYKARPTPNLFTKVLDHGTRAAKIIGHLSEGPLGYVSAAETFGGMVKDKIDGKL